MFITFCFQQSLKSKLKKEYYLSCHNQSSEWGDIDMTLYDPITPSGAQAVMDWARLSYESVTGRAGYSDFYKKDLTLQVLGPVGDIVSEWVIKGAFITNMDQGGFDWATDETVELSMTVAMDYCVLNF